MTAAIKTFGGGYGPGMGLGMARSTRDKIALASQVGRSRRLAGCCPVRPADPHRAARAVNQSPVPTG